MSKPSHIQIYIPAPCPEEWGQMTPCGQGRHCQQCDKTVVDFTTWTDAAIREFFSRRQAHVCGRYHVSQLGRPLHIPPQPHSHLYRMVVAMGLTLLFTQSAIAQNQRRPLAPQDAPKEIARPRAARVSGMAVNENNGPLYGATVQILQHGVIKAQAGVDSTGHYFMPMVLAVGAYELYIIYADRRMRVTNFEATTEEWLYDIKFNGKDAPVLAKQKKQPVDYGGHGDYVNGMRSNIYHTFMEEEVREERDSIGHLPVPEK